MKSKLIVFLFSVFSAVITTGCLVTRQQVRETVKSEPLTAEQQRKSTEEVRYQEVDEQMRMLNGRVETLENSMNMLSADKSGSSVDRQNEKRALDEKLKIYEEAIAKLESQNLMLAQKVEAIQISLESKNAKPAKDSKRDPKNSFDAAADDFANKQWKEAIVSFEKYRSMNPNGKKYAEATYKMAASFQELGLKTEAKAFYSEVVEKYPKSEWAQKAKQTLKSIK